MQEVPDDDKHCRLPKTEEAIVTRMVGVGLRHVLNCLTMDKDYHKNNQAGQKPNIADSICTQEHRQAHLRSVLVAA